MLTSAGERRIVVSDELPKKMLNNNVLVKVDSQLGNGHVHKTKNLDIQFAGCEYNETAHIIRYGEVVLPPERLLDKFTSTISDQAMDWVTEMEIELKDRVYFGKMASANAVMIVVGDDNYFLIPYSELILRVRGDEIYPLNGYALLEKKVTKTRIDGLVLEFGDKHDKRSGIVTHVGRPNGGYFAVPSVDADIDVGDEVVFGGDYFGFVEEEMFASLPRELGYVQRRWIQGKI